jgi:hypothetical protein
MVTCVPDGVEVRRCEPKFQTTPSIVRVVPAAPDTQLQPPLVVALMFRGICADGATTRGAPVVTEGVCERTLSIPRTDTLFNGGHDIVDDCEEDAVVGPWFPAASWTAFAFNREIRVPAPVQVTDTVIVVPAVAEVVYTHPVAVPVFDNADADRPEIASLNVKVYDAESEDELVAVDHDAVGGVVSAGAGIVT